MMPHGLLLMLKIRARIATTRRLCSYCFPSPSAGWERVILNSPCLYSPVVDEIHMETGRWAMRLNFGNRSVDVESRLRGGETVEGSKAFSDALWRWSRGRGCAGAPAEAWQ
jgi:hypothetical protein